jgi:hypothetical protein
VLERKLEHDAPADRAAHHDRALQAEFLRYGEHHSAVAFGAQAVILVFPTGRRRGLAVPRHVEGDNAKTPRDRRIVEHRPVLTAVGAGGVQAEKRDALARLLEVQAVLAAAELDARITADDRLELHADLGAASTSLRYSR